ncbi:MAG TPA: MerR family transcriptional regulator [Planctomycetota bacterium]
MKNDEATAGTGEGPDERGLVKIGDFARLAGTNLRTLRYYEEIGLLRPAARSPGGFRYYRREDLDRLAMVNHLQQLGLELARIHALMDTRAEDRPRAEFVARVRQALEAQAALIDERMAALASQRAGLGTALAKLEECSTCSHVPAPGNNFCHPCQLDGKRLPLDLSALF